MHKQLVRKLLHLGERQEITLRQPLRLQILLLLETNATADEDNSIALGENADTTLPDQLMIGDSVFTLDTLQHGNINVTSGNDVCISGGGNCLSTVGGGSMSSFTLSGDGGADQTISDSNTLEIAGGTSITTTGAATDTMNIDVTDDTIDGSELADTITLDAVLAINSQDVNFDVNTLFVDVSADRVGIGTTGPASALHVIGDINGSGYVNASTDICITGGFVSFCS